MSRAYKKELTEDIDYNKQHPLFADVDDDTLGQRREGYFIKAVDEDDEGNTIFQIVMDNGHTYYTNGADVQRGDDIPDTAFIHKYIEKALYDFLASTPLPVKQQVYCSDNEVEITSFIRIVIHREQHVVCITNILVPQQCKYHNHGKRLISLIYRECKQHGYRLLLVDMVQSFYNRMVKRGATIIVDNDIVEITDNTDLSQH